MAKPPRPPRPIKRSAEPLSEAVASQPLIVRRDPRQAELFRTEFILPCKPTLRLKAPSDRRWQFEIKHDGYRAQCHVNGGQVRIFTKNGFDWAARMPAIVASLEQLPVSSAVIDGEAVMEGPDGITDFFALHTALANKSAPRAFLYAFDLLHLNAHQARLCPAGPGVRDVPRPLARPGRAGGPAALSASSRLARRELRAHEPGRDGVAVSSSTRRSAGPASATAWPGSRRPSGCRSC